MSRLPDVAAVLLVLALLPASGPARAAGEVPVGPRAIAMGNAFTAVADGATALFWNPAGLPGLDEQEITLSHADLFGSGIRSDYAAFALPLSASIAAGADWYSNGFDDGELVFGDNRIDVACGVRLRGGLSLGANAKYVSRNTRLDDVSVRQGSGTGLDLGVLCPLTDGLSLGASLADVFDTRLDYTNSNGTSVIYERALRVGAAWQVRRDALLALDVDDRVHLGAEFVPFAPLALRAGVERDLADTGEDPVYGMGLGVRAGIFRLDYSLTLHPILGATNQFGLTMGFNFNPPQVRIERVEPHEVFSSLQKSYAREPLATARLHNLQDRSLTARLQVFAPDLMDRPSEREVVLRPRATQDVPLTALLSDKVIAVTGDRRVPLVLSVNYQSTRLPRTEKRTADLIAYGPGAIRWGAGVAQAAAFVTWDDPVIVDFSRRACWPVARTEETPFRNRNLGLIAAIYDALGALDIAYVPDPNTPYQSQTADVIDNVQYPRQTLARRSGDCDDTSVLLAALLENVGVPTRFVDAPGHLFLLAGTGVHERNRFSLGLEDGWTVVADEQVWIPLETTAFTRGFARAWREGSESYGAWASRGAVTTVGVQEAQTRYEPGALPSLDGNASFDYDAQEHEQRIRADAAVVSGWHQEYMDDRYGAIRSGLEASPGALNDVAHVYYASGQTAEARAALERALPIETDAARTRNNLADTYRVESDLERALDEYRAALASDSTDAGIWFNAGLAWDAAGDTARRDEALSRAIELGGGIEPLLRAVGVPHDASESREGSPRMTAAEARALLRTALASVPAAADTLGKPPATRRGATRPWPTRVAGARSSPDAERSIRELLYWRR